MNRYFKRMLFALAFTATSFAATEYWYRSGQRQNHSDDGKAFVATLADSVNEVQRKEARRVIWENISLNDQLYLGEAIRTTEKAEAKIKLKSGTTIHLEPDSLIVLEENGKGVTLDFLQGNLFVQGQGEGESATDEDLTLKTGSGQIKLKSADMSLSKDQNGQVSLEVFKGQAELQQGGQKLSLAKDKSATLTEKGVAENKDRLTLLMPQAGDLLLLNMARGEKLDLRWKPLSTDYQVTAEIGASRAGLEPIAQGSARGEAGQLLLAQKPGKWFVRLVAQSSDKNKRQLVSMTVPFTVELKSPPILLEPNLQNPVIKEGPEQEVEFRWLNRNHFSNQILEVAKDPAFKNVLHHQDLSGEVQEHKTQLKDATYFWRVTGYLKGQQKREGLASPPQKFEVRSNLQITPVTVYSPANRSHLSIVDLKKAGASLQWQPPFGVKRFKVIAQRKDETGYITLYDHETDSTHIQIGETLPGSHRWKITSLDSSGAKTASTDWLEYTVDDVARLEWTQPALLVNYAFTTATPTLVSHWKPLPTAKSYRFRISPVDTAIEKAPWQTTQQEWFDVSLPHEGQYHALVQALNANGASIAQTEIKTFKVQRAPLLPPPRWTQNAPEVFKADRKGSLSLTWEKVEGAQNYLMILEDTQGQPIEQRSVSRNMASVTQLKPGKYRVKLKAVDIYRRPGNEGDARTLEVPLVNDIKAPKIKAVKVK